MLNKVDAAEIFHFQALDLALPWQVAAEQADQEQLEFGNRCSTNGKVMKGTDSTSNERESSADKQSVILKHSHLLEEEIQPKSSYHEGTQIS